MIRKEGMIDRGLRAIFGVLALPHLCLWLVHRLDGLGSGSSWCHHEGHRRHGPLPDLSADGDQHLQDLRTTWKQNSPPWRRLGAVY